jgi:hypothetical protein
MGIYSNIGIHSNILLMPLQRYIADAADTWAGRHNCPQGQMA